MAKEDERTVWPSLYHVMLDSASKELLIELQPLKNAAAHAASHTATQFTYLLPGMGIVYCVCKDQIYHHGLCWRFFRHCSARGCTQSPQVLQHSVADLLKFGTRVAVLHVAHHDPQLVCIQPVICIIQSRKRQPVVSRNSQLELLFALAISESAVACMPLTSFVGTGWTVAVAVLLCSCLHRLRP